MNPLLILSHTQADEVNQRKKVTGKETSSRVPIKTRIFVSVLKTVFSSFGNRTYCKMQYIKDIYSNEVRKRRSLQDLCYLISLFFFRIANSVPLLFRLDS